MLKVHRLFIIIGIVFIVIIGITVYNKKPKIETTFNKFVNQLAIELEKEGFSKFTIDSYLQQVAISQAIYSTEKKQAININNSVYSYYNDNNILLAQQYFKENNNMLNNKSKQYNIPVEPVIANMVVSSQLGANMGIDYIISILTTKYVLDNTQINYIAELKSFLKLVEKGYVPINSLGNVDGTISYLGLTPTVYLLEAVDGNNDGIIDLYNDNNDIIETAFAFFKKNGYKIDEPISHKVNLSTGVNFEGLTGIENAKNTSDWQQFGITKANGENFNNNLYGSLTIINQNTGVLNYHNFNLILKLNGNYNKSVAIGILSEDLSTYLELQQYKNTKVTQKTKPTYTQNNLPKKDDILTEIKGNK